MPTEIREEFIFPTPNKVMAKLRFEVELSDAQDILWNETQRGLLSYFAMCSHETYMKLAEALNGKCTSGT